MKQFATILSLLLLSSFTIEANTNCHKNKLMELVEHEVTMLITDKETGEPIPFAYFTLSFGDSLMQQFMADSAGSLTMHVNLKMKWTLQFSSIGYIPLKLANIRLSSAKPMGIQLESTAIKLDTFVVMDYKNKLIDKSRCRMYCRCGFTTVYYDSIPSAPVFETPIIRVMAFPNPTLGEVTITHLEETQEVFLMDMSGKILQTIPVNSANERIDLSPYSTGLYFIQYVEMGKPKTMKIIKN